MKLLDTLGYWTKGVRLYLAVAIGLLTAQVWWWGSVVYGGSNLASIRIQEAYGWLSVAFLAVTLLIGPILRVWSNLPAKVLLRDARRLLGIGAAWFALLHAGVAYIVQFQNSNPWRLPTEYQQALLLGVTSLLILLALALTSFNRAMKVMGAWWFRLHRLVYFAALCALVHAFLVGVHATSAVALLTVGSIAAVWILLKIYIRFQAARKAREGNGT